jgi:MFS family permease
MADVATAGSLKQDVTVVGLVSGGHFMSHYYTMMLPPLFPLLHNDLGVSYAALGLLLSLKSLSGGTMQLPAGILVDRFGARALLLLGFGIMVSCYFIIASSTSIWLIGALFLLAGIGNAVFHPADYSIMNGTVNESRIGRSFSAHTFAGHLGSALAPAVILGIASFWNWRAAVMISCVVGIVIMAGLMTQWSHIREAEQNPKKKKKAAPVESINPSNTEDAVAAAERELTTWQAVMQIIVSKPMLFLFLFFALQSLGSGGFRNFAVAGLVTLHATPEAIAGSALTGFLFASAFGVLVGGVIADYDKRHALTASIALSLTACIAILVGAVNLHYVVLVGAFTLAGLVQGIIRPARDMMIRNASPKGAVGKAFGFVFSGQAIGGTIAPVVFGLMIDLGRPDFVFYTSGVFMLVCVGAVLGSAHEARKEAHARAAHAAAE